MKASSIEPDNNNKSSRLSPHPRPIRISAAGCCLVDYVYQRVSYDNPAFQGVTSQTPGDGGIIPGGLVFTEDLELFSGTPVRNLLEQLVDGAQPDTVNLGGPAIIALANATQLLTDRGVESRFYGWIGDDKAGRSIQDFVRSVGIQGKFQVVPDLATPSTIVLSDPKAHKGHGERSFLNTIGAAGVPRAQDLPDEFYQADVVLLGGTALTPGIHDDLTQILKTAKNRGCITLVGTVFDFRNEKHHPQQPWPLGNPDGCKYMDVLICDAFEARRITGKEDLTHALATLIDRGAKTVLITNGEQDGLLSSSGELFPFIKCRHFPVHSAIGEILRKNPERFADTTGCGDNFLGGFLASLATQLTQGAYLGKEVSLDLDQALAWATSSGGFTCFYPGGLYQEKYPGEKVQNILPLVEQYRAKRLVQWGAGNIGRSFIGQIFARNGWAVTFVDVDSRLIEKLNQAGGYKVIEVTDTSETPLDIRGIDALNAKDRAQIAQKVLKEDLLSISVGKQVLSLVLPELAGYLVQRYDQRPQNPIDILIAENMTDGAEFVRTHLKQALAQLGRTDIPLDSYVGLVETSLGKMVPIQNTQDPLTLLAEPFNTLVVDRQGFLGSVPLIPQIKPVDSMKAWVLKKLYVHNLGHAAAAYLGYQVYPDKTYLWEVLEDDQVRVKVQQAMRLGAQVVQAEYPGVFTSQELEEHLKDLLSRFQNRALGDTLYRVGRDVGRKLAWDDRIGGALLAAYNHGLELDDLARVLSAALDFRAPDPVTGEVYPQDQALFDQLTGLLLAEQISTVLGLPKDCQPLQYEVFIHHITQIIGGTQ